MVDEDRFSFQAGIEGRSARMSGSIANAQGSVLKKAFSLHQQGKLDEAASLYRKVLTQYPRNADAL
jgi:TolA-binding protein